MVKKDDYNIDEFKMGREIEGLDGCVLFKHKGLTGIIRKTDKTIIVPPKYHNIWDFKEGRAKVRLDRRITMVNHAKSIKNSAQTGLNETNLPKQTKTA